MAQTEEQRKESIKLSNRRYYERNKERLNKENWARKKAQNYFDSGETLSTTREYRLLMSAKSRSKRRLLDFDLEIDDIIIPTNCPVLGIALIKGILEKSDSSPSLDRINPQKGYVKGNVIVISWRANRIKNDGSWQEHQAIADFYKGL